MYAKGANREVYHIGNDEEIAIRDLVALTGQALGQQLDIVPGVAASGGTPRRCPDIGKMRSLGHRPGVALAEGLARTCAWYEENRDKIPANDLM
jgi:UDP-glucose 4-epimerase